MKKISTKRQFCKKISLAFNAFFLGVFGGIIFMNLSNQNSQAAAIKDWQAGNIISDSVMSNKNTMNVAQIQKFLESKNSCNNTDRKLYEEQTKLYPHIKWNWKNGHFVCMADDKFDGETAAEIIYSAAQDYSINPQVLIVLLEKEQGLITDTYPNSQQYKTATGFGCPDTAACDSKYFGLKNQVRQAAALFREVLNGGWSNYPAYQTTRIYYNPDKSCGSSKVYIENRATSALYRYTPYQPNQAALNAGTGEALCGAYGNRNFYNFFKNWFGNPRGSYLPTKNDNNIKSTTYIITSKLSAKKAVDVAGGSTKSGANIQLYQVNKTNAQKFKITKTSDGYYQITNIAANKNLDVYDANTTNGTNVWLYNKNNTCAQKWVFEKQSDGYYEIKSACSGLNLDVYDGNTANRTNIQIYNDNNTPAQRWKIEEIVPEKTKWSKTSVSAEKPNSKSDQISGNFYITSKLSTKKAVDVADGSTKSGANIQLYQVNKTNAQKFKITKTSDGYYQITNIAANKNLDVYDANTTNGTNVWLYNKNNTCAQKWVFEKQSDGYYEIKSACSGLNLDVYDGNTANRTNIQIYNDNNTPAQRWKLNKI